MFGRKSIRYEKLYKIFKRSYEIYGPDVDYFEYEVEQGDSLSSLKSFYFLDDSGFNILDENGAHILNNKTITPGQTLKIPLIQNKEVKTKGVTKTIRRLSYFEEIVAATLLGEGASGGTAGMKRIYSVIKNRAGSDDAKTMAKVCLKKYQFSFWNDKTYKMNTIKGNWKSQPNSWNIATKIVKEGLVDTEVGDSTFYLTESYYNSLKKDAKAISDEITLSKEEKRAPIITFSDGHLKKIRLWTKCFETIYTGADHVFGLIKKEDDDGEKCYVASFY